MSELSPQARERLAAERNIWVASVRPDGRPHLAPVWFAWHADRVYICTDPRSVKARNLERNGHVSLALEDGTSVVICEGRAAPVSPPWPADVISLFRNKYEWDITTDEQYTELFEIIPVKWLIW